MRGSAPSCRRLLMRRRFAQWCTSRLCRPAIEHAKSAVRSEYVYIFSFWVVPRRSVSRVVVAMPGGIAVASDVEGLDLLQPQWGDVLPFVVARLRPIWSACASTQCATTLPSACCGGARRAHRGLWTSVLPLGAGRRRSRYVYLSYVCIAGAHGSARGALVAPRLGQGASDDGECRPGRGGD